MLNTIGDCIMHHGCKWIGIVVLASLVAVSELSAYFDGDFDIQRHFLPKEENFYDWKAYQLPLSWQREWYTVKNGIQATAGSLSQELFYTKHNIKLQADLHENFSLLYFQEREEFYKSEPIYQQIEARFGNRYYLSILGFPKYEKKDESLGLAVSYNEPYTMKHAKLTYLNQLATYNAKNIDDDRNQDTDDLDSTPQLLRLETRYRLFDQLDVILDLAQELEGVLLDGADGLEKRYCAYHYRGKLIWDINAKWVGGLAFQQLFQERSHKPFTPSGAVVLDQQIDLYLLDLFVNVRFEKNELTLGYLDSGFKNRIGGLENYMNRLDTKHLYVKWHRDLNHWMKWFYSLQAGTFDYTRTGQENDDGINSKAGLGMVFFNADNVRFLVLTTWTADSISSGQWDGGNMQLQISF
jgi:hypothetical protein